MNIKHQQGATLIIVLIVLLLVTIIGTIAMRSGILNLNLSTNNQVNNLLIESNDAALMSLENPNFVEERLLANGMYGYFLTSGNENDEMAFCYNANNSSFFSLSRASIVGLSKLGANGYCTATTFATGRKAVITQVYLRKITRDESVPFANASKGTGLGSGNTFNLKSNIIATTVVSVFPAFVSISDNDLRACFQKGSNAVEKCFDDENVPYNVQYSEYNVGTGNL